MSAACKLPKGSFEYVSINAHVIRANAKHGTNEPPIRIAKSPKDKAPRYAHEIKVNGDCRLVYDPEQALLGCGARLALVAPAGSVEVIR